MRFHLTTLTVVSSAYFAQGLVHCAMVALGRLVGLLGSSKSAWQLELKGNWSSEQLTVVDSKWEGRRERAENLEKNHLKLPAHITAGSWPLVVVDHAVFVVGSDWRSLAVPFVKSRRGAHRRSMVPPGSGLRFARGSSKCKVVRSGPIAFGMPLLKVTDFCSFMLIRRRASKAAACFRNRSTGKLLGARGEPNQ